ncbi:MAG: TetR/AcrR family transcriptional regulator, partial [Ilumatobacter sp.]
MSDRRSRIIAATNELFRVWGYHGTSLSQISEASQATTGSIYHFFPGGKEELTVAVIESTADAYRQLFEVVADEAADPASAYVDFFEAGATVLVESDYIDPCPIGSIAREVASTSEPLRIAAQAAFDSWIGAVTNHLTAAGVGIDTAGDLAVVFVGAVEGGFVLSRTRRSPEPLLAAGR